MSSHPSVLYRHIFNGCQSLRSDVITFVSLFWDTPHVLTMYEHSRGPVQILMQIGIRQASALQLAPNSRNLCQIWSRLVAEYLWRTPPAAAFAAWLMSITSQSSHVEFIFHGTGTSGSVPTIHCLTAPEDQAPCETCLSTLRPEGKKNIRRNTGAVLRVTRPDSGKA